MAIPDVIGKAQDMLTVRRVFGEPYEKDGVTVIPAASVRGGGGGGGGEGGDGDEGGSHRGWGGGLGIDARPVGAYVIRGGDVRWVPALDLSWIIVRSQVLAVVALRLLRGALRRRARRLRAVRRE